MKLRVLRRKGFVFSFGCDLFSDLQLQAAWRSFRRFSGSVKSLCKLPADGEATVVSYGAMSGGLEQVSRGTACFFFF